MDNNDVIRRAVRVAMYANAAAAVAGMSSAALAQDQPSPEAAPLQEVVVTGSRVSQPGLESISPVTAVSSEELKSQGTTRVEDLLNSLPMVNPGQGSNISNAATGTATVDLRGLGPQRTLVLVNGRRLMPGEPTNNGVGEADLNQIPAALVDRVDVLTGGASAVYGADAVAGVVNFVMNDHFQGFRIDANASMYQHDQHSYFGQFAPAANFGSASSSVGDGSGKDLTFILGSNFADGKGNVTAYAGWRKIGDVLQATRDFSRCTIADTSPAKLHCGGSSTNATGRFLIENGHGLNVTLGPNQTFVPYNSLTNAYNYGALNYYQRPDERFTGGAFAHYNVNDNVQVYSEFMAMNDRSIAQVAPSGAFLASGTGADPTTGLPNGAWVINCDNPFMTAAQQAAICKHAVGGLSQVILGRRNVEGGPRQDDLQHTSFRAVIGTRGEFADIFSYDAYFQEGRTMLQENYRNDVSKSRLANALLAVVDPTTGQIVCQANANGKNGAPGCIPYNIFGSPLASPAAAVPYFVTPGLQEGVSEERIYSGNVTGDFTKWGAKLPTANSGLIVNLGAEYREESVDFRPDEEYITNDLAGQGNPTLPLAAGFGVKEVFTEMRLPLVQDMPFMKEISVETGYRYSKYDLGFSTNTYKFGVDWAPTADVRFRGSYQRAVRAPSISELFRQKFVANDFGTDPCAGSSSSSPAAASLAQCARSGVTPAQYGKFGVFPPNPAGQYQGLVGGNPTLKPEISDTYTFGIVLTPSFLPDFSATIDYYDIKLKDVINSLGAQFTLNQCLASGNPNYCNLVNRDSLGSLWLTPLSYVTDLTQNLGAYRTKGVDVTTNYRLDLHSLGKLTFQFAGTYVGDFLITPSTIPGFNVGTFNCAGYYGNTCGNYNNTPQPNWRHRFRTAWSTPFQGLEVSAQWRHIGNVHNDNSSPNPLLHGTPTLTEKDLGTRDYLDLGLSYEVLKGMNVRLGVNNVLDKDPPIIAGGDFGSAFVNGNTFPQLYDTLGRYMFVNITADF
jgi:outer membrane receptor protein involved in Fe transport